MSDTSPLLHDFIVVIYAEMNKKFNCFIDFWVDTVSLRNYFNSNSALLFSFIAW